MKHRGRHRRRRRGAALRAALAGTALALTATATIVSASQATVAEDPGALKPLTSTAATARLGLREHLVPRRALDRLASAAGGTVGVADVLQNADHTLREAADCDSGDRDTLPVTPAADEAYCWDPTDTLTDDWRPASVTTSSDADDDGLWGANRVVLAGWTHSTTSGPAASRGLARIAVVDANDPAHPTYAWVLLTVPSADGGTYRGLTSQISGMAWYENKLLVTTTLGSADALYVYDLNRIQRTSVLTDAVGRVRGGWSADGFRYAMPAVGWYSFAAGACSGDGAPCPSALSVDRGTSPDSLVLGEWTTAGGDRRAARLWRYAFDERPARAGLLATDAAGRVGAVEAYRTGASEIRGVLSYRPPGATGSEWYVGHLPGAMDGHGSLWRQDTDGAHGSRCGSDASHRCWAAGTGSLSYASDTGEVWSISERMLFSTPLRSIDASLS
ncbi:hypothetical protein AB0958_06135 [Streptomyces sp. NPDC006655]|uniref:hypothetical protein n=1 Tax=Streptomyces sp. NPDC006655 TaxID=3156898 RepID=UPI0034551882